MCEHQLRELVESRVPVRREIEPEREQWGMFVDMAILLQLVRNLTVYQQPQIAHDEEKANATREWLREGKGFCFSENEIEYLAVISAGGHRIPQPDSMDPNSMDPVQDYRHWLAQQS
jgi:hypothetical protein